MKYRLALSLLFIIQYLNIYSQPIAIEEFPALPDSFFKEHIKDKSHFYILENVNIIPMNMDIILKNQSVLIKDGKILKIDESNRIQAPGNAEVIDCNGKYLIPGLADMHVHFKNQNDLLIFLANGITTIRNMMGHPGFLDMRKKVKNNIIFGPTIYTTSPYISKPENNNQAEKMVFECKKTGYDYLKIYGFLNEESYREIMKQSRNYGIKAVGHLPFAGGVKAAIEEKQFTIEHIMQLISQDGFASTTVENGGTIYNNLKMVAQSGTWLCITHSPILYKKLAKSDADILKKSQYRYIHPAQYMSWLESPVVDFAYLNLVRESTKKFFDMNGKIILGTDCGMSFVMPGFSVHEQLETFVKAGLTPYQALKTATYNAADCLGTLDESGTIEINKDADMVLINGNPFENINNTRNIEGVMLKGIWFSGLELQEMLDHLTNYYRNDIIPQYTKKANMPEEVKNIYFGEYKFDGKSNTKARIIFGITVLILSSSTIFTIWKIKQKNKSSIQGTIL